MSPQIVFFLVFVIIAAAITSILIIVNHAKDSSEDEEPPKADGYRELPKSGSYSFDPIDPRSPKPSPRSGTHAAPPVPKKPEMQKKAAAADDVAVVYESVRNEPKMICSDCSCEYGPKMQICEICGRNLRRR